MTQPIIVEGGVNIGPGITISSVPSLTITSADFNYGNYDGGTSGYITPSGGNLFCPVYYLNSPNGDIGARFVAFFAACGLDINTSYVFNASFATATPSGSGTQTPYSCLVRLDWQTGGNQLDMVVIDQTDTGWQSGYPGAGTQLQGTFLLPVTLTPYTPTTSMGPINWC
jgi:hypothetical protein